MTEITNMAYALLKYYILKFNEPGSGVYGMLLTKAGYIRTSVQPEEPNWTVKLVLKKPHIHMRADAVTHLGNAGRMFDSYAPSGKAKAQAVIEDLKGKLYILKTRPDANTNVPIKATATFSKDLEGTLKTSPAGSTIFLELLLGEASSKKYVEVLQGLKFSWDAPMLVALIIKDGKITSTNPTLRTQVEDTGVGLQYFYIEPKVGFIMLLFTTATVPESYLYVLTGEVERLNYLMTKS